MVGGRGDEKTLQFETTVVTGVSSDDSLMSESVIFSPEKDRKRVNANSVLLTAGKYLDQSCLSSPYLRLKKPSSSSMRGKEFIYNIHNNL